MAFKLSHYRCVLFFIGVFSSLPVSAQINQNTVESYLSASQKAGLKPNRLITEGSPYLLQHAYNPVQWFAWGEEAFEKARKENKPIFLSIGYSTCHWCHVMEHESFENEHVAKLLNDNFISIKVDREERPDIDSVYMAATRLINGHGGWPMTVFLNHDYEPFHAGTYYPRESIGGRRGLIDLLLTIDKLWKEDRARVDLIAGSIAEKIKYSEKLPPVGEAFSADVNENIFTQITQSFDTEYGGFGNAPKFPRPGIFSYLKSVILYSGKGEADKKLEARLMLQKTLDEMAYGGIYDQIGGGFHRYSVDAQWQVPHFEKMLYSQALMTLIYTHLYDVTKKPLYKDVITRTLQFVKSEMTHPDGGFYSALDADSAEPEDSTKKSEGAYYLWLASDLKRLLSKQEWAFIKGYFDIQENGNIGSDPQNEFGEKNIFYVAEDFKEIELSDKQLEWLNSAYAKLNIERITRPRPHLDDKIISAWNGMMISALSNAYMVLKESEYLESATRAAKFIEKNLLDNKTLILKRHMRSGRANIDSGLSDYVWMIRGLIDLYRSSGMEHWLSLATGLQKKQDQLFFDHKVAAYYDSTGTDNSLLFRSKSVYDGALPAVNAIAIENLYELSRLTKNREWKVMAEKSLNAFASVANTNPAACASLLAVRYQHQNRSVQVSVKRTD